MFRIFLFLALLACFVQANPVSRLRQEKKNFIRDVRNKSKRSLRKRNSDSLLNAPSCYDSNGNPINSPPFEKLGDCDHFYQCSDGVLYTMPCAAGTVFNPQIVACDWPHNVPQCSGSVATTTEAATTTTQTAYDDNCLDSSGQPISSEPFESSGGCETFYQCSNGHLYEIQCPLGTVFDPSVGVCNHTANVPGCGGSGETPKTEALVEIPKKTLDEPSCRGSNGQLLNARTFQIRGSCDKFYQCLSGNLYTFICAGGSVFNPAKGVCDWPRNVPGC